MISFKTKIALIRIMMLAAQTSDAIDWSQTHVELLNGSNYEVGRDDRTVFTFKHVNKWKYGDNVFFWDHTDPFGNIKGNYAEFSPRLSFSKMTGKDYSFGPIKDVLLAGTYEMAPNKRVYLGGIGTDLKVPGLTFAQLNSYVRDTKDVKGETWQFTLVWQKNFELFNHKIVMLDAMDYSGREGRLKTILHSAPQFLVDIGKHAGVKDEKLFVGVEYEFWRNKFGIAHRNEDNAQVMIKWVF